MSFCDAIIILDFLEQYRPQHQKTVELIEYLAVTNYIICISEDMLTTIYYISKQKPTILKFLKTVVAQWEILNFGESIINRAITAALERNLDLEDLLQCLCAGENGCAAIITHDKSFYDCGIAIYIAGTFLQKTKN
ncbi:MAG: type II toxin-antitoxin system VapC family toxin [Thermodesulfobacteriota bacterium]|nr:type II toxin-antitoxin system VapC family toxin [Thermodesulfobacteriota bacterium]